MVVFSREVILIQKKCPTSVIMFAVYIRRIIVLYLDENRFLSKEHPASSLFVTNNNPLSTDLYLVQASLVQSATIYARIVVGYHW